MRAIAAYADMLRKAAGDHGGHIIGRTKSGKVIYASGHNKNASIVGASTVTSKHAMEAHPSFSASEHLEAAEAHATEAGRATTKKHRDGSHVMSQAHSSASMAARARDKKISPS